MSAMNAPRTLSALIATAVFAALPAPQPAQASTALQRCTTADGGEIFTDRACGALGARNAPIPAAMMTRLARTFDKGGDAETGHDVTHAAIAPAVSRRAAASGCARTPQQLEMDLRGSLALGDVNRIAESYHWTGLSHKEGQRILSRLESLADQPVRKVHYFDAQIIDAAFGGALYADASGPRAPVTGNAGTLQLQLGTSSISAVDLSVERYAGCYFVRF
ncbi:hypothetical protein BH23PSE2_BH23PSE2_10060 [soil metagenome]